MSNLLIRNIKILWGVNRNGFLKKSGVEMSDFESIDDAFLCIENGKIIEFGKMSDFSQTFDFDEIIDASGKMVIPSFVDSHTHLVYAGSREIEYIDKIKGLTYEEIAKRGGGILNSAKLLHETSEDELFEQSLHRIREIEKQGTCAVEIKSGYGLYPKDELKMLRVIQRLKTATRLTIKSTFLAAHAVPADYKGRQSEYVDFVVNETLHQVGEAKLADFVDVFCDKGFFTVSETERIVEAAANYGLRPKIHANELDFSGGVQVGVKHHALSVDHLEYVGDAEISALLNSKTMPTILPGAALFLNLPHAPARKMIDAGLPIAVASDFNPGSSPSGNMKLMLSLAMINHRMTVRECLNAGTINTAYAMNISDFCGSIKIGNDADCLILKEIPSLEFFLYAYGSDLIETVVLKGQIV
jgi:imidazolonepropionase